MMGRTKYIFAIALGLTAAGCQSVPVVPALPPSAADAPPASGSWRATATDARESRAASTSEAWMWASEMTRVSASVSAVTAARLAA